MVWSMWGWVLGGIAGEGFVPQWGSGDSVESFESGGHVVGLTRGGFCMAAGTMSAGKEAEPGLRSSSKGTDYRRTGQRQTLRR